MLLPALALNGFLLKVEENLETFRDPKTRFGREVGAEAGKVADKNRLPRWSKRDQRMIRLGAALLVLSFGIKVVIAWNTPT
jgi:hypothetical protein